MDKIDTSNQIDIATAIFSFILYFPVGFILTSSIMIEPINSLVHWRNFAFSIVYATLYFYVIKTKLSFSFGLLDNISFRNFSIALGCAIIGLIVNSLLNLHVLQNFFKESYDLVMGGQETIKPLPVLIFTCIIVPMSEELMFRGYILKGLRNKYGTALAFCVSLLLFSLGHVYVVSIFYALTMGIILGLLYLKTGSVFSCMITHVFYNIVAMFMSYNYPNFLW